jgi:glutamate synthase domain-containing protein 1
VHHQEIIPHRATKMISDHPFFKRYFAEPDPSVSQNGANPEDYIVSVVMEINTKADGTFVVSSGKNMGAFKGVGFPEDIADFFQLEEYEGYIWTAHNRFPTNTPGWWAGAHPFTLLDRSIVHNGEISSYGINKRYLETKGYICTLMTDTEVVAYLLDILLRKNNLSYELAFSALAPPFWKDIDRMNEKDKIKYTLLRSVYAGAALNGPFAFLFGFGGGLIGINDRVKLRPLIVGTKGESVFMSSEEASIREICPDVEDCFAPQAGEPVIVYLNGNGQ